MRRRIGIDAPGGARGMSWTVIDLASTKLDRRPPVRVFNGNAVDPVWSPDGTLNSLGTPSTRAATVTVSPSGAHAGAPCSSSDVGTMQALTRVKGINRPEIRPGTLVMALGVVYTYFHANGRRADLVTRFRQGEDICVLNPCYEPAASAGRSAQPRDLHRKLCELRQR